MRSTGAIVAAMAAALGAPAASTAASADERPNFVSEAGGHRRAREHPGALPLRQRCQPGAGLSAGFDRPDRLRDGTKIRYDSDRPGPADTWGYLGAAWASAVNTPFRYWKKESFEGGTRTPAIVHWPRGLLAKSGSITTTVAHVMDVMPTLVELAGARHPSELAGRSVMRSEGTSLVPILRGRPYVGHETLYWEHEGGRAVRHGAWKRAALPDGQWELFDLSRDRSESRDVSARHPQKVAELAALWTAWRERMSRDGER